MGAGGFFELALVLAVSALFADSFPGAANDDSLAIVLLFCAAGSAIVGLVLLVVRLVG